MSEPTRPESARIAGQLRRAFYGEAWHGDSLFEIPEGVTAAQASAAGFWVGFAIHNRRLRSTGL
jgi:hypothetical protein